MNGFTHIRLKGLWIFASLFLAFSAAAQTRPNVVLIFVDDLGINDIGAYAYPDTLNPYPASGPAPISYSSSYDPLPDPNEAIGLTPNIDSLASDGLRMTSFYASAPVCTPSRAGMLTGCYPTRVDMEGVIWNSTHNWGLNPSEVTIAERLKQAGYTTALMGKWHVGTFGGSYGMDFHPTRHGFDTFFGLPASNDAFLTTLWDGENEVTSYTTGTGGTLTSPVDTVSEQRYLLEALTEKSLDFIDAADAVGQPFFLYFASHAPHTPCWPHPDYINASGASQYYDVVNELDARVGQILDKLDALGIANNTLVLFTSDNGPWVTRPDPSLPEQASGSAYPFRGYKRGANEGGPRVPFLARYPGQISAGTVTDELGSAIDFLPTLVTLAGESTPAATIDGVDLWPLLSGATSTSPRSEFFFYEENDTSAVGVRQGDDKLLNSTDYGATTGWFDLSTDIQESTNLGANSTLSSLISSHNSAMSRRTRATSKSNWIEVDSNTVTVTEGGTATFNVRLHAAANTTVNISRFSGDTDLSVQSGASLSFTTSNYDQWQTVTLAAANDGDTDSDGATFRATASGLYLREIFALEDDVPPNPAGVLSLSSAIYSAGEGAGTVTITVNRTGGTVGAVSVDYATGDGSDTASPGSDYTATSGTLNWGDGGSADKTFDVTIADDAVSEGDETFTVTLSNAVTASLGSPDAGVTITDNDVDAPATISGLVGWYDAQELSGNDGAAITTWADKTGGTNSVSHDLTQVTTGVSGTAVAPTVQTVALNGFNFRSLRFVSGNTHEYEQLQVNDLVSSSNTTRTIIAAYKGGVDNANSRPVGFGSRLLDGGLTRELWNLATDGSYGSSRFDGAFIGPYSAASLTRDEFLLRTAVMESKTSFDEFIDELDPSFADTQRLSNGTPSNSLATVLGSFHVGDVHNNAIGGGVGAADFDILEILVYDRVLTTQERQDVQAYLVSKYTSDPAPLTPAEEWRQLWFGQTANSGDAADDFDLDKDGLVNLLERAFGSDPTTTDLDPAAAIPPYESVEPDGGNDYLAITYRRLAGGSGTTGVDYTAEGIAYTVEYDTDLADPWSTGSVLPVGSQVDNGDGTERVTVRLTTPISTDGPQFIRLRVTQN